MAVNANHIYWANANGTIMEAGLDGSNPTQLVSGQGESWGMAVDANHIYWTNYFGGTIMEAGLDGSNPTQLVGGQNFPGGVAVDANHIYWSEAGAGTIMEAGLDGSNPTQLVCGQAGPYGVAVDAHHIYWANQGDVEGAALMKASLDGSNLTTLVGPNSDGETGVAVGPFPAFTSTITGTHTGGLTVGYGQDVLVSPGAVIHGRVIVQNGGSIDIESAKITGPLTGNQDPGSITACGSTITGSITITGDSG